MDAAEAEAQPIHPLTEAAFAELERPAAARTWLQSAFLLIVSIVIFAMAGIFENKPVDLVILIGVLLFHELGHYAGMRWFNYQDVRMFFIPFFGAAVAGKPRSVEGFKEAIVLLLGPLPGIVLGTVLGAVAIRAGNELLRSAAVLLVILNGFNLLPFMPLDGGRVLHLVLFSRNPYLEAAFRVLTGGLLAVIGLLIQAWFLALIGVSIVFGTLQVFRISKLAHALRGPLQTGGEMDLSEKIPRELAIPLIERAQAMFPQMQQPRTLANVARQIWDRIHLRPPGLVASLAILFVYAAGFLGAFLVSLVLVVAGAPDQPAGDPNAQPEVQQDAPG